MLEQARVEMTVKDYWEHADDAYDQWRDTRLDWEADIADLAEQRRGGFNRD
jgi:hypothetical protein